MDFLGNGTNGGVGVFHRFQVGKVALRTSQLFDLRERLETLGTSSCSSVITPPLAYVGDVVGL